MASISVFNPSFNLGIGAINSELKEEMQHPFQAIPVSNYRWVFLPFLVLTLIWLAVLWAIPLNPSIVQFEFSGTVLKARVLLESWDEAAQIRAAFNLGLDFLYIVLYSTTISLACIWAAKVFESHELPLASVGILLAWGQSLAALLDVVEDIALIIILFGSVTAPWPQIAMWCAISKFSLVILGLLYAGIGGVVKFLKPRNKQA